MSKLILHLRTFCKHTLYQFNGMVFIYVYHPNKVKLDQKYQAIYPSMKTSSCATIVILSAATVAPTALNEAEIASITISKLAAESSAPKNNIVKDFYMQVTHLE